MDSNGTQSGGLLFGIYVKRPLTSAKPVHLTRDLERTLCGIAIPFDMVHYSNPLMDSATCRKCKQEAAR